MSAAILTAIIASCIVFAAGLCALVYWYAFRFEPVNFKVSDIKINIAKNTAGPDYNDAVIGDAPGKTGECEGIVDNAPGISGEHSEITDKTAYSSESIKFLPDMAAGNISKSIGLSASSTGSANKASALDFTILHLSDFHLRKDRKGKKLFEFVRSLSSYNPDFIFITGDLVEKDIYFDYLVEMLEELNARVGKYAVFGVHDYYNKTPSEFLKNMIERKKEYRQKNDVSGLISKLDSIGIKVLRNERVSHPLSPDFSINITGLEDYIIDKTDIAKAFGKYIKEDIKEEVLNKTGNCPDQKINRSNKVVANSISYNVQATNKNNKDLVTIQSSEEMATNKSNEEQTMSIGLFVPEEKDFHDLNSTHKIEICLTHTPDLNLFSRLSENGVDIVLAGHTHGGQVRLPGIGAIISGCNMKAKYASGLFYFKKFVLYVSRGLGEGRYSPFRFYCPPEATVIKVCFTLKF